MCKQRPTAFAVGQLDVMGTFWAYWKGWAYWERPVAGRRTGE